jgi:hypothetical protein
MPRLAEATRKDLVGAASFLESDDAVVEDCTPCATKGMQGADGEHTLVIAWG